jgi:hypothetical protein
VRNTWRVSHLQWPFVSLVTRETVCSFTLETHAIQLNGLTFWRWFRCVFRVCVCVCFVVSDTRNHDFHCFCSASVSLRVLIPILFPCAILSLDKRLETGGFFLVALIFVPICLALLVCTALCVPSCDFGKEDWKRWGQENFGLGFVLCVCFCRRVFRSIR